MRTILFLVRKEALQVLRDRVMLGQIFVLPLIQILLIASAATFEVKDTYIHVIDEDRTPASRELIEAFFGSGRFVIARYSASTEQADEDLLAREVDMILHIPEEFGEHLTRRGTARIQLIFDATAVAAGVRQAYAVRIVQDYAARRTARLRPEVLTVRAPGRSPHLEVRTRAWYNPTLDYDDYMAPGILVILVTFIGTLLTAQNIVREKEMGTLEQLNVTPITKGQFIAGKLLPFWVLGLVELAAGLVVARLAFDIPLRGSVLLVFGVAAVYLVAALGLGLLISTVTRTQQQAQLVTFFIMMIYLFMSGMLTPVSAMPEWAQWLAELNPVKHFIFVIRTVLMRGAGMQEIAVSFLVLAVYGVSMLALAVRQYSKTSA